MNTEIILILASISLFGLIVFWLFYRQSNNTQKQAQQYLLTKLQDKSISVADRTNYEKQLSNLLQNKKSSGSLKITAVVALFVIPFSFYFYAKLGDPSAINYNPNATTQASDGQAPQMSMEDAIAQLEQRLQQDPDNLDGQMLYARSQISLKNFSKAVKAYRKANQLAPNEAVIMTELAEAIGLNNNNRSFLGEPEKLLAKAVELEPNNQKALWLLGMTFYEHKDYKKTNELWSKLYDLVSDAGAKKQLTEQLNDIRAKLGLEGINKSTPNTATDNKINLSVKIALSEKLQENLKGKRALLYVYSKEPTGMPMPIAVIKQPLEQIDKMFPIQVTMNDSNSLQPTRILSNFSQIKIGARISFSGNAMPQAGDLQSKELLIDLPYSDTIELLIDKVR